MLRQSWCIEPQDVWVWSARAHHLNPGRQKRDDFGVIHKVRTHGGGGGVWANAYANVLLNGWRHKNCAQGGKGGGGEKSWKFCVLTLWMAPFNVYVNDIYIYIYICIVRVTVNIALPTFYHMVACIVREDMFLDMFPIHNQNFKGQWPTQLYAI